MSEFEEPEDGRTEVVFAPAPNTSPSVIGTPKTELPPQTAAADHYIPTASEISEFERDLLKFHEAVSQLVGVILHKHGCRAVEITPRDIAKYKKAHLMEFSRNDVTGTLRYELTKKPKSH